MARNRIIDFFRKKRPVQFEDEGSKILLPSADAGPDAAYRAERAVGRARSRRWRSFPKNSARCLSLTKSKGGALKNWPPRPE